MKDTIKARTNPNLDAKLREQLAAKLTEAAQNLRSESLDGYKDVQRAISVLFNPSELLGALVNTESVNGGYGDFASVSFSGLPLIGLIVKGADGVEYAEKFTVDVTFKRTCSDGDKEKAAAYKASNASKKGTGISASSMLGDLNALDCGFDGWGDGRE